MISDNAAKTAPHTNALLKLAREGKKKGARKAAGANTKDFPTKNLTADTHP